MIFFAEVAVTAALLDRQAVIVGAFVIALHQLPIELRFADLGVSWRRRSNPRSISCRCPGLRVRSPGLAGQ